MTKPIIGITMGEPAGIGPEIAGKALWEEKVYDICNPVVIGDAKTIQDSLSFVTNGKDFPIVSYGLDEINKINFKFGEIAVIDLKNIDLSKLKYAVDSEMGGKAVGEYITTSIDLALAKKIHAVVTAPISKPSFQLGGWGLKYPGHTEMYADLTGTKKYTMLLAHKNFRVVHVSVHVPLSKAIELVKTPRIIETIQLAKESCKMFGIPNPHIAVCGLNPHSGDGGKLGHEDDEQIVPAIEFCKKEGLNVVGPIPADTVWPKLKSGYYDIVVANYHDQGHIPTKLLGFQYDKEGRCIDVEGVNITIGIPMIRVSVDHGTAYGKAGKGIATPTSLLGALEIASTLAIEKYNLNN
jgi:4-hydroxythreonine-4-phosphate dehydrogenase